MLIRYHTPHGNPENQQDTLPANWQEIAVNAGELPIKFGVVDPEKLFRGGMIWSHQVERLKRQYGITHIISLISGDWLSQFYDNPDITIHQFPFYQRRELTFERVKDIVDLINSLKEPAIVHCMKGVTKSGMVCAGYKIINGQRSNLGTIIENIRYGYFNISSIKEVMRYSR